MTLDSIRNSCDVYKSTFGSCSFHLQQAGSIAAAVRDKLQCSIAAAQLRIVCMITISPPDNGQSNIELNVVFFTVTVILRIFKDERLEPFSFLRIFK